MKNKIKYFLLCFSHYKTAPFKICGQGNPFAVRQFLLIVIEGVFQENIPNIQYGSQLQNVLLEVRVLHRFISWQLRVRFWVVSSLLLDDSENKENQTFKPCLACQIERKDSSIFSFPFPLTQRCHSGNSNDHSSKMVNNMFTEALQGRNHHKRQKDFTYTYLLDWSLFLEIIDM